MAWRRPYGEYVDAGGGITSQSWLLRYIKERQTFSMYASVRRLRGECMRLRMCNGLLIRQSVLVNTETRI